MLSNNLLEGCFCLTLKAPVLRLPSHAISRWLSWIKFYLSSYCCCQNAGNGISGGAWPQIPPGGGAPLLPTSELIETPASGHKLKDWE